MDKTKQLAFYNLQETIKHLKISYESTKEDRNKSTALTTRAYNTGHMQGVIYAIKLIKIDMDSLDFYEHEYTEYLLELEKWIKDNENIEVI